MKCIKNKATNEILRVDDQKANQMVGSKWEFISKTEWKSTKKVVETVTIDEEKRKKQDEKALRHLKLKAKQREPSFTDKILK